MFLTKEELIKEHKENYSFNQVPTSRLSSWFYYEPIPTSKLIDINEFIKNNIEKTKYNRCNEYIAIRGAGHMFSYDKDIIVVSINTIFSPSYKVSGKTYKEYFVIRVYFLTIDDSARSISLYFNNNDEYIKQIEKVKFYLYQNPYLDTDENFEKYWSQFDNVDVDFN